MFKSIFNFSRDKTFKPLKGHKSGKQAALHAYAAKTLGSGDVRAAVRLPEGEDENEWLATNTLDFFNTASLLYGTVAEYCTPATCPAMTAGPRYEYLWAEAGVKPTKMSAPEYIDSLMSWVEKQMADESIFPTAPDRPFPKDFRKVVSNILKRLHRVFAHIYHSHFDAITQLGAEAHLNTAYKHFVFFVLEFNLVDRKAEMAPMEDLVATMTAGAFDGSPGQAVQSGAGAGAGSAGQQLQHQQYTTSSSSTPASMIAPTAMAGMPLQQQTMPPGVMQSAQMQTVSGVPVTASVLGVGGPAAAAAGGGSGAGAGTAAAGYSYQ